jgi:hypothetical protein
VPAPGPSKGQRAYLKVGAEDATAISTSSSPSLFCLITRRTRPWRPLLSTQVQLSCQLQDLGSASIVCEVSLQPFCYALALLARFQAHSAYNMHDSKHEATAAARVLNFSKVFLALHHMSQTSERRQTCHCLACSEATRQISLIFGS